MKLRLANNRRSNPKAEKLSKSKARDINRMRKDFDLKPLNIKTRPCLRCDAQFVSEGPGHRMCDRCLDYARRRA